MKILVGLVLLAAFAILLFLMYQSQKLLREVQRRQKAENAANGIPDKERVLHPKLKDVHPEQPNSSDRGD